MEYGNEMLYLIEGAEVTGVEYKADRETIDGKGLRLPTKDNNLAFRQWGKAFFTIIEEILHHKRFFERENDMSDKFVYFGYHVTSEPMSWAECESALVAQTLGVPDGLDAYDSYSDLTGYLWTTIKERGGHNVLDELCGIPAGKYVSLKFSITPV